MLADVQCHSESLYPSHEFRVTRALRKRPQSSGQFDQTEKKKIKKIQQCESVNFCICVCVCVR